MVVRIMYYEEWTNQHGESNRRFDLNLSLCLLRGTYEPDRDLWPGWYREVRNENELAFCWNRSEYPPSTCVFIGNPVRLWVVCMPHSKRVDRTEAGKESCCNVLDKSFGHDSVWPCGIQSPGVMRSVRMYPHYIHPAVNCLGILNNVFLPQVPPAVRKTQGSRPNFLRMYSHVTLCLACALSMSWKALMLSC